MRNAWLPGRSTRVYTRHIHFVKGLQRQQMGRQDYWLGLVDAGKVAPVGRLTVPISGW